MNEQAKTLFELLFGNKKENEFILISNIKKRFFCPTIEEALRAVEKLENFSEGANQGVFFGPATRIRKLENGAEQEGGKKGEEKEEYEINHLDCLWSDIDGKDHGGKPEALEAAENGLLFKPTVIIDSGHGYHCYWKLSESVSPEKGRAAMIEIYNLQGGDVVYDVTRIMRIPGTFNKKEKEKPVECKIVLISKAEYLADDIISIAKVSPKTIAKIRSGDSKGYKSRSERDWAVVTELIKCEVSDEAILRIFSEFPVGEKFKEGGNKYLLRTIEQAKESTEKKKKRNEQQQITFTEKDGAYFLETEKGTRQISTFIYEPTKLLHGEDGKDALLGTMKTATKEWPGVALTKNAFSGVNGMLKELPIAQWQWLGSDKEVRTLLPYLMGQLEEKGLPTAKSVTAVGRHENFWVAPNIIFTTDQIFDIKDAPIVCLSTGRETPILEYDFLGLEDYIELVKKIFYFLPAINSSTVVWPILGWYATTPLKPILNNIGIRFPILNLYGSRGGGKTSTILRVMQPLFGYVSPKAYDCVTTQFVILSLLSSTNSVPISFGEFRRATIRENEFARLMRYLLLAYDIGHDARGKADQTTQDYPLSAPITVDGEDMFSDAALKERSIIINLNPFTIEVGSPYWEAFNSLTALPLSKFAGNYIRFTLRYGEEEIRKLFLETIKLTLEAIPAILPDRVRRNMAVCLMGLHLLYEFLPKGLIPELSSSFVNELFSGTLDDLILSKAGRTSSMVDEFIEELVNQAAQADSRQYFSYKYNPEEKVLYFHLSTALGWWFAKRRREGRPVLESAAMKVQLRERSMSEKSGPGQYITTRKAMNIDGTIRWCYGVSLEMSSQILDVPENISEKLIVIKLK